MPPHRFAEMAVGDPLPKLRGEFLTGRTADLPQAASGRVALLLLGFTYDSRFAVEAWARRFREQFETDPRVTFYEIPMIGGLARLGKWFIDSGMRRGTPKPITRPSSRFMAARIRGSGARHSGTPKPLT